MVAVAAPTPKVPKYQLVIEKQPEIGAAAAAAGGGAESYLLKRGKVKYFISTLGDDEDSLLDVLMSNWNAIAKSGVDMHAMVEELLNHAELRRGSYRFEDLILSPHVMAYAKDIKGGIHAVKKLVSDLRVQCPQYFVEDDAKRAPMPTGIERATPVLDELFERACIEYEAKRGKLNAQRKRAGLKTLTALNDPITRAEMKAAVDALKKAYIKRQTEVLEKQKTKGAGPNDESDDDDDDDKDDGKPAVAISAASAADDGDDGFPVGFVKSYVVDDDDQSDLSESDCGNEDKPMDGKAGVAAAGAAAASASSPSTKRKIEPSPVTPTERLSASGGNADDDARPPPLKKQKGLTFSVPTWSDSLIDDALAGYA